MSPLQQKQVIKQIYNFVILTPSFEEKSEFMRLKIFFNALHESQVTEFEAFKPYEFKFGFNEKVVKINTLHSPGIVAGEEFIEWLCSKVK